MVVSVATKLPRRNMIEKQTSILIVADEPRDVAAYRSHLMNGARHRYRIQHAGAGEKALALLRRRAFDCVLLDLHLLDLKGLAMLLSLVAETGDSPCGVVLLTASADRPRAVEAMKHGAHDYLEKELITPERLRRTVANAIEKAALLGELDRLRREIAIKDPTPGDHPIIPPQKADGRSHAKMAPQGAEQLFKHLVENLPGIVWLADSEGGVTYINDRWTDLTGLSCEQSAGDGWIGALHPDDVARVRAQWEKDVASGQPSESRHRYRTKDGEYRWHLCRSLPLRDESGKAWQWAGFNFDIHDRHEAEEALRASEARLKLAISAARESEAALQAAMDAAQMGTWEWDLLSNQTKASDLAKALNGDWPENGQRTYDWFVNLIHPDDREEFKRKVTRALAGEEYHNEFRVIWPDGSIHWLSDRGQTDFDESGRAVRLRGLVWDITERKLAEEKLSKREEQFRSIFDLSGVGMLQLEPATGRFLRVNRRFREWLGYSKPELLAMTYKDVTHPEDLERNVASIKSFVRGDTEEFIV